VKILMLSNNYVDRTRGGVEMHVYNLARALVREGHEVQVVRTSPGPSIHEVDETVPLRAVLEGHPESVRGVSHQLQKLSLLRFAGNFLERIRTAVKAGAILRADPEFLKSFDLIHHHDFVTSVMISRIIKSVGVTQVWTNHLGEFLMISRLPVIGHRLTRLMTRTFVRGVGPSAELSDQSAVSCPIEYISNGVNTELFTPLSPDEKEAARKSLGWESERIIAIVPRRWAPTKGVIFAAQAMSSPEWPVECDVVFAGAGESDFPEYSAKIRTVLDSTSVAYKIYDSLSMENMALAIQAADFCIIPSLMEATSLSALEAMSAGLPVIGTKVGGLPEIIEEGVNGHLVPPMEPDAIASSSASVCGLTSMERNKVGQSSRERVSAAYSWEVVSRKTMQMYQKAMA
jgi:glycosyltransferase involved in cell wall biosynthesis